ncbi:rhodanese-like domain-containing protein [Rhodococcus olei]|uniref:Rhodanese-like domain-containing protein n=1 Tax=Rhodococcus olei TaxID=2161675 RepID=A0ABP8PNQ0_9NOCA
MTIDEMLENARNSYRRTTVFELEAAVARGAMIVDIRPQAQRDREGTLPGALAIERNVLEWRLDPASGARIALAVDHDVEWIVVCSEGYTSSLAAAALQELGLRRATDLVGGYRAIRAAGLLGVATRSRHLVRDTEAAAAH